VVRGWLLMTQATTNTVTDFSECRHLSLEQMPEGWFCLWCGAHVPDDQLPPIVRPA
jgi:nitrate reductase cytochrome c-type subunit